MTDNNTDETDEPKPVDHWLHDSEAEAVEGAADLAVDLIQESRGSGADPDEIIASMAEGEGVPHRSDDVADLVYERVEVESTNHD